MKMTLGAVLSALAWMHSSVGWSLDYGVPVTVTGKRVKAPIWVDGSSNQLTEFRFNFNGFLGSAAAEAVNSTPVNAKLVYSEDDGLAKTVVYTKPTTCTIGTANVLDTHVELDVSGTTYAANSDVAIVVGTANDYKLSFSANGNYGLLTGDVACANNGSMTYSY